MARDFWSFPVMKSYMSKGVVFSLVTHVANRKKRKTGLFHKKNIFYVYQQGEKKGSQSKEW